MKVQACVRSGFCCEKTPCGYGDWNHARTACKYLDKDADGIATCLKYSEIIKDPNSKFSPAFGYGCCMSLANEKRNTIIRNHYNGEIPLINID